MPSSTKTSRIEWICKSFTDLSTHELYAIHRLRNEVFVVEQGFIFLDTDNRDQISYHLCGWYADTLVAYVRLLPNGLCYDEPSIGRVCTALTHRGIGLGRELMTRAVEECERLFGKQDIKIEAEAYLTKFYESLGFEAVSGEYDDCGAPHLDMMYHPAETRRQIGKVL